MSQPDVHLRDARGEWRPDSLPVPSPLFSWPLRARPAVRAVVSYFLPYTLLYAALSVASWLWFTPDMTRTAAFEVGWMAEIYARNAVVIILFYGGMHLRLYMRRAQGDRYKYSNRWPAANARTFLFNNQHRDNVFWTLVSGGLIWSAYETLTLWMMANKLLWWSHLVVSPVYLVLLVVAVPAIHTVHFYWGHRLIHWKPLYRLAHYLHHKNVNPGPWSGMAMHPIEHLIYLSGVFLHWVIPSHPIAAMFQLMFAGMAPAPGHTGFNKFEVGDERTLPAAGYFHYLHHKYFDCNYGGENIPLDQWFGSFFDGSTESEEKMRARRKRLRGAA